MWKGVKIKMPRMKNIDIDFISLVNKGANKQTVKIYKSDNEPLNSNDEEYKGFFNVMKSFFSKVKEPEKITKTVDPFDFNSIINQSLIEDRVREARWALMDVLENILDNSSIVDKATSMSMEIDKFKNYIISTVNTVGIAKALEEVREIKKERQDEDMKVEGIKKMLDEALNPIKEDIKVLKREEEPVISDEGKETPPELTTEEIIAKAIKEATEPIIQEVTELKKSRRAPQSLDPVVGGAGIEVKKSYIGAFEGMFN